MSKELHEMTLQELYEEACGRVLLAIGKGKFRAELYTAMELSMRNGFDRGKHSLTREGEETLLRAIEDACHAWNMTPAEQRPAGLQEAFNKLSGAHQEVMRKS